MMNANLILQGRSPNIVNALAQATQAAGAANQVQHQNALRNLYAENGAGLVSNDPNAVNALAGLDPQAALGIQGHHSQEARATRNEGRADRQLDMQERRLSAEEARQVEAHKQRIGAQAAAQEAEQAERVLFDAALLAQQGDLHGVNKILMDAELTPVPLNDLNQFPILAGKSKAVLDALKSVDGMGGQEKAPAAVQALQFRAQAAGLQPGTPEYANFMLDGGRKQDGLRITQGPDGMVVEQGSAVGTGKPPSERQSTLRLFGGLMDETMPALNAMEDDPNFDPTSVRSTAASKGTAGNIATTPKARQYESLKRQWAEGVLRIQTGAAATESEIVRVMETYFPRFSDDPGTVEQKRVQRDVFARSLGLASGGNVEAPGGAGGREGLSSPEAGATGSPQTGSQFRFESDSQQALFDKYSGN